MNWPYASRMKRDAALAGWLSNPQQQTVYFAGAGISIPSALPGFKEITHAALRPLLHEVLDEATIAYIADRVRPEKALDLAYDTAGPPALSVLSLLEGGKPNPNHFFLAKAIQCGHIVLTTNVECLIEEAAKRLGYAIDVVTTDEQFSSWRLEDTVPGRKGALLKLHGSIEADAGANRYRSIAVTLKQLGGGLSDPKQAAVESVLRRLDLCFMGYSGADDFTVMPLLLKTRSKRKLMWFDWSSGYPLDGPIKAKEAFRRELDAALAGIRQGYPLMGKYNCYTLLSNRTNAALMRGDSSKFVETLVDHQIGQQDWEKPPAPPIRDSSTQLDEAYYTLSGGAKRHLAALALSAANRNSDALAQARQAIELSESTDLTTKVALTIAGLERSLGADGWHERAVGALDTALAVINGDETQQGNTIRLLTYKANVMRLSPKKGHFPVLEKVDKHLEHYDGEDRNELLGEFYAIKGLAINQNGDLSTGVDLIEQSRSLRVATKNPEVLPVALNSLGIALFNKGSTSDDPDTIDRAQEFLHEAAERAMAVGDRKTVGQSHRNQFLIMKWRAKRAKREFQSRDFWQKAERLIADGIVWWAPALQEGGSDWCEMNACHGEALLNLGQRGLATKPLSNAFHGRVGLRDWHKAAITAEMWLDAATSTEAGTQIIMGAVSAYENLLDANQDLGSIPTQFVHQPADIIERCLSSPLATELDPSKDARARAVLDRLRGVAEQRSTAAIETPIA